MNQIHIEEVQNGFVASIPTAPDSKDEPIKVYVCGSKGAMTHLLKGWPVGSKPKEEIKNEN